MADTGLHVVLVAPEIHWNTGNAGRTCLAAGATLHLVQPLGFSLDAREVRRAGLDYWPRVDLRVWRSWGEVEASLFELGEPYFFSPEADRTLWETSYAERSVLVFGCETKGLPGSIRNAYRERLVSLPMEDPGIRSLNLSTTVGIALYEVLRQRRHARKTVLASRDGRDLREER
jgi:tRNA (cytidine/uridine-2'-O-)-methyltransferase